MRSICTLLEEHACYNQRYRVLKAESSAMKTYFTAADVPLSKASAGFTGQVPPEKDQKSLA